MARRREFFRDPGERDVLVLAQFRFQTIDRSSAIVARTEDDDLDGHETLSRRASTKFGIDNPTTSEVARLQAY
ncbi:hypothetical protein BRC86_08860 [Halobacteriales archaeon QS_3_64_16]|nr:MAG: hypothetical protein BRC86_08860 [Halobacteriales archaeon QS_3_64_16]